ncbi:Transcriptional regulator PadR-like family protein [compost metagenome]
MERLTRRTPATAAVIGALMESPEAIWGLQIVKMTGLKTGTVYPILERLEDAGWITSEWDTDLSRKGPRRRYFKLEAEAVAYAQEYVTNQKPKPVVGAGFQSRKLA